MGHSDLEPGDYADLPQDEPVYIAAPASNWRRAFARLGAGAFFVSLLVHVCFVALAIFAFYTLVAPPPDPAPDFSGNGGGGGGDGGHRVHHRPGCSKRWRRP